MSVFTCAEGSLVLLRGFCCYKNILTRYCRHCQVDGWRRGREDWRKYPRRGLGRTAQALLSRKGPETGKDGSPASLEGHGSRRAGRGLSWPGRHLAGLLSATSQARLLRGRTGMGDPGPGPLPEPAASPECLIWLGGETHKHSPASFCQQAGGARREGRGKTDG